MEGFYGKPWSQGNRKTLFDWMFQWGLNTYLYAPKDDLKQRAAWRELYDTTEAQKLCGLVVDCQAKGIRFFYALSPGLDIRYSRQEEVDGLKKKFEQLAEMGCRDFALLFDDIPDRMEPEDRERFGSFAAAQAEVTNVVFDWARQRSSAARFLFCPTPYCGRMAENKLGGDGYLEEIGQKLLPGIDVFWTGPEIISHQINADHVRELETILRRKPLIWDNLHANDYDGRRFFCGPYAGRTTAFRKSVSGVLSNPNCEFPLNYVPLRTLAEFLGCEGEWDARNAYLKAMSEWLAAFEVIKGSIALEDLVLFGDCFYLPHEEGARAGDLYRFAMGSLDNVTDANGAREKFLSIATRLQGLCSRVSELRDRELFYALSRRVWELREELDLWVNYLRSPAKGDWKSDAHLPGTYRGGFVAGLQKLLVQDADGAFRAAAGQRAPG